MSHLPGGKPRNDGFTGGGGGSFGGPTVLTRDKDITRIEMPLPELLAQLLGG